MHRTTEVEHLLQDILDTVFDIYQVDRAWLLYPCDPEAPSFQVPIERTHPDYPGALTTKEDIPMESSTAKNFRDAIESDAPMPSGPNHSRPVSFNTAKEFSVKSQIFMAIYPKIGKPWLFGMHQCSYARSWTNEEQRLFKEIGRRIADGLSSLLLVKKNIASLLIMLTMLFL